MEKQRQIQEAILNDKIIQQGITKKVEIYSLAVPTVLLKNGKAEMIWIDETNHPLLKKINELIECRMQEIINFYK